MRVGALAGFSQVLVLRTLPRTPTLATAPLRGMLFLLVFGLPPLVHPPQPPLASREPCVARRERLRAPRTWRQKRKASEA